MHRFLLAIVFYVTVCASSPPAPADEPEDAALLAVYRDAAMNSGDAVRGKAVFASKLAACIKCHAVAGKERMAGPDLAVIGDKYTLEQLIQAILEPSVTIHPDYAAQVIRTANGKVFTGVLHRRTDDEIQLLDAEGKRVQIPLADVEEQQPSKNSLMPTAIYKTIEVNAFADLIAYLTTLKQQEGDPHPGMPSVIQELAQPVRLTPLHAEKMRFDHPVCIIAMPNAMKHKRRPSGPVRGRSEDEQADEQYLIVEQKTRKIWLLEKNPQGDRKELFADLSSESITGEFEGVMCLALHPNFLKNRKYYLNYHVREEGIFSPVIVERQATEDGSRDAGGASRRLLRIKQPTDLHWGGMLAFGPDGYLYIGAGDGGPQEDPDGNGQNLSSFLGKILRIDVDHTSPGKPYAIPPNNPFKNDADGALPEIWAYGMRMPWRFSWDSKTGDLWVGNIGQDLFEEVLIARVGENHGWNVYEGFMPFSEQYRREGEKYVPPVFSYRRKEGVSVTGGYVYRGRRSPSFVGAYIFGDFESKRLWALTQKDGKLDKIRQIGVCPEKPASFGIDNEGELFVVGYQGTIYRLELEGSVFE